MKAVIFAGGLGTRFSERTQYLPKPMIEIGGKPILWHIMKIYSSHGIEDFIICCGYKQYIIKEFFLNYFMHNSDMTIDLSNNSVKLLDKHAENWKVTLVDTGLNTMTAGRLRRVRHLIGDETFCLTYGDGVGNVNITDSIKYHNEKGKALTMTVTNPKGRFGTVSINHDTNDIFSFEEKPGNGKDWINIGFLVCSPKIFDYLPENSDELMFEKEPLNAIAADYQMTAFKHTGFWKPMDMLKDNIELETMWENGSAPWKTWD